MVPILVDDMVNFLGLHPLIIITLDHRSHAGLFKLLVYGTYKGLLVWYWRAALWDVSIVDDFFFQGPLSLLPGSRIDIDTIKTALVALDFLTQSSWPSAFLRSEVQCMALTILMWWGTKVISRVRLLLLSKFVIMFSEKVPRPCFHTRLRSDS